jgi:uncharacterized protein (TIGR00730 family)
VRWICVFCGSSVGSNSRHAEAARLVGRLLAAHGLGLVYGGASIGLMGILADEALAAGGRVVGVIPRALAASELAHRHVELHFVDGMHARKQLMHELSDAFLTLPGGYGTLDELFETLTWSQLGIHRKPVGVLNVGGYFAPLLQFVDNAVAAGLLGADHRALIVDDADATRLLGRLAA